MWTACCTPSPPPDTSSSSSYTFHPSITSLLYLTHFQPGLFAFLQTPICSNLHVQHHFHLEQLLVFLCKSSMPLSEIIVCMILHGNTTPVLRTVVVGSLGFFLCVPEFCPPHAVDSFVTSNLGLKILQYIVRTRIMIVNRC